MFYTSLLLTCHRFVCQLQRNSTATKATVMTLMPAQHVTGVNMNELSYVNGVSWFHSTIIIILYDNIAFRLNRKQLPP